MNVTHRLIEFAKYLNMSVSAFEATINQAGRLQAAKQKDRNPNTDLLEIISEKYSDLNMNWVISGKGEMLITDEKQPPGNGEMQKQVIELQQKLIACYEENQKLKESTTVNRHTAAR
jgi:hypothetical protein